MVIVMNEEERLEALRDALFSTDDPALAEELGEMVDEGSDYQPLDADPAPASRESQAKVRSWLTQEVKRRLSSVAKLSEIGQ